MGTAEIGLEAAYSAVYALQLYDDRTAHVGISQLAFHHARMAAAKIGLEALHSVAGCAA